VIKNNSNNNNVYQNYSFQALDFEI